MNCLPRSPHPLRWTLARRLSLFSALLIGGCVTTGEPPEIHCPAPVACTSLSALSAPLPPICTDGPLADQPFRLASEFETCRRDVLCFGNAANDWADCRSGLRRERANAALKTIRVALACRDDPDACEVKALAATAAEAGDELTPPPLPDCVTLKPAFEDDDARRKCRRTARAYEDRLDTWLTRGTEADKGAVADTVGPSVRRFNCRVKRGGKDC